MGDWAPTLVAGILAIIAGPGFWAYMQRRDQTRGATDRLLRGLAYDKICSLGMKYIERGWITKDEYEEYRKFLYEPYKNMGGNGVTERVMAEVSSLPLKPRAKYSEVLQEAKKVRSNSDNPSESDPGDPLD